MNRPMRTAAKIVPITAPIEMSDVWSVGNGPVGATRASPCRSATPHDRHTWAHSGLARPQL